MKTDKEEWWTAPIGAAIISLLFASIFLMAMNGWKWFTEFLTGPAANWVQAFGSIAAILAAYKMGQNQIEANRILEAERITFNDQRKLTAILAVIENLEFHLKNFSENLEKYKIPSRNLCSIGHMQDVCIAVKSINIFDCPSTELIPQLAILPRYCDLMFDAISDYDKSFDELNGDTEAAQRGLQNSISLSFTMVKAFKESCIKAINSK
ncbi:MAG: hypothetical protein NTZ15_10780 [Burkholderiales bacterium]|nr:hypothetical protein [Burkholderiales bacterium]